MTFFVEMNGTEAEPAGTRPAPEAPVPDTAPPPRVGPLLKARRLERGWKHKDISRDIKIKTEYLKAIEDEEFDLLPTPQYTRLFLKSYAEHLGLDVQEIYGLYDTREIPVKKVEKKEPRKEKEPVIVPAAPPPSDRKYGWMIGGGVAVVVITTVLLVLSARRQPPADEEAEPLPLGAVTETSPTTTGQETDIPPVATDPPHQFEIRARDSVWLVVQADGDTLYVGFLMPGEISRWTARSAFGLSLSSSANAEARFNGRYLKPFAEWNPPIQGREVGEFNIGEYLDSTRLAAGP